MIKESTVCIGTVFSIFALCVWTNIQSAWTLPAIILIVVFVPIMAGLANYFLEVS